MSLLLLLPALLLPPGTRSLVTYGDPCTNQCEEGNPTAWCGGRRTDARGRVMRCTEGTK